jgi:hypothetical protein
LPIEFVLILLAKRDVQIEQKKEQKKPTDGAQAHDYRIIIYTVS